MGTWDKIKSILIPDEDEFDDFDDDDEVIYQAPEVEDTQSASTKRSQSQKSYSQRSSAARAPSEGGKGSGQVMDIQTTAKLQVVLTKPEHFDEASEIADELKLKRTVVLNLESANRDQARRLVDFLSGVAYANGGQLKRIANSTFIITPYNVDVMGDLLDELESSGVFF